MDKHTPGVRRAQPTGSNEHGPRYEWTFTDASKTDLVELRLQPVAFLPVVFVPGIMGTNLVELKTTGRSRVRVWNVDDAPGAMVGAIRDPSQRQADLHFARTQIYEQGKVPDERSQTGLNNDQDYWDRGWGEVGYMSYGEFLLWLERTLNASAGASRQAMLMSQLTTALGPQATQAPAGWQAARPFDPIKADELTQADRWLMPVYACGYNWLGDNARAAERLQARINAVIERHHDGRFGFCRQVVLITHSMGGLVARACQALPDMQHKIAGVLHGVMPTLGAPVAYRRCKVGMGDEGSSGIGLAATAAWGAAKVIGQSGQHVTPVFAQSPGALQLLPSQAHPPGWLRITGPDGRDLYPPLPSANPYDEIYRERIRWWGLVRDEWLRPQGSRFQMDFSSFEDHLDVARKFHTALSPEDSHPCTYAFYGHGGQSEAGPIQSFESVQWRAVPGKRLGAPPLQQVPQLTHAQVNLEGSNPEHIGKTVTPVLTEKTYSEAVDVVEEWHYELRAAGPEPGGDGTVNRRSAAAVGQGARRVRQVFTLPDIAHEPAYKSLFVRRLVVYAVLKISAQAINPLPFSQVQKR